MNHVAENICPWCESGFLIDEKYDDQIRFGRSTLHVEGLLRQSCDNCGETITNTNHFEHNTELIRIAERKASCFVSPAMLRAFREKYGLSQKEAGRLLGVGESAFGKYETGSRLSAPTAKLIRVALNLPAAAKLLAEEENMVVREVQAEDFWTVNTYQIKSIKSHRISDCVNDNAFDIIPKNWMSSAFEVPTSLAVA